MAHRGASALAPENTLSSIRKALEVGSKMVEIDVHTSRDGEIVVMHDKDVSRTTDGKGLISELDLSRIRILDAGSWFAPQFSGERVPTLEEALSVVRGKARLCIEIKQAEPARVLDKARELGCLHETIIFDFDHARLRRARRIERSLRTLALGVSQNNLSGIDSSWCTAIGTALSSFDESLVGRAHEMGLQVFVYTVNDREAMIRLAKSGVDAIITNHPHVALEVAGSRRLGRP